MADTFVKLPDDSANVGQKVRNFQQVVAGQPVNMQAVVLCKSDGTVLDGVGVSFPTAGDVAAGTADSGNPVKTGGKYNLTPVALADGTRGDTQLDGQGHTLVSLAGTIRSDLNKYKFRNLAAAVQAVKASAGTLYMLIVYNGSAAPAFVQVFDKAAGTVVLGTDTPDLEFTLAASAQAAVPLPTLGVPFGTAISIASTTAEAGASGSAAGVMVWAVYK